MGSRIDLESYTFKDGIAPGETISVVKNNNGPWTGNLGWTAENAGNYTMEIALDPKATIAESNRGNNGYRQAITVNNTSTLSSYMVEKIFRAGATEWTGNQVVDKLRLITNPESIAMGVAMKGAAGTWNAKRAADLSAENKAYFMALVKLVRPQDVEMWERLANAWKIEIPSTEAKGKVVRITLQTIKEAMKYSPAEFKVPAGATVELIFENVDAMQHNWVLGALGSQEKIGLAADKMITAADGAAKNYIPSMPEVLAFTPLVESDGRVKVVFKAPSVPGNYPFLCTFPGHWRIMNGVMKVE
jgi:azurin